MNNLGKFLERLVAEINAGKEFNFGSYLDEFENLAGKENAEPEVERGALEGKENQEQLEAIQKILSDWLCSDKKI